MLTHSNLNCKGLGSSGWRGYPALVLFLRIPETQPIEKYFDPRTRSQHLLDYCKGKETDQFIFPFLKDKFRSYLELELGELIRSEVTAAILGIDKNITLPTTHCCFAEHLIELIGEIKTLQDSLDHTDISTTQRHISHFPDESDSR